MIGDKLKKLRKNKGLTLKDLGNKLNMSPSFLSDIENNRTQPSLVRLKDVADVFDISICQLLDEKCEFHETQDKYRETPGLDDILAGNEYEILRNELMDLRNWSTEDRNELISYLKAKRIARSN